MRYSKKAATKVHYRTPVFFRNKKATQLKMTQSRLTRTKSHDKFKSRYPEPKKRC